MVAWRLFIVFEDVSKMRRENVLQATIRIISSNIILFYEGTRKHIILEFSVSVRDNT